MDGPKDMKSLVEAFAKQVSMPCPASPPFMACMTCVHAWKLEGSVDLYIPICKAASSLLHADLPDNVTHFMVQVAARALDRRCSWEMAATAEWSAAATTLICCFAACAHGVTELCNVQDKLVAAVCHGPGALTEAELEGQPLVKGKKVMFRHLCCHTIS